MLLWCRIKFLQVLMVAATATVIAGPQTAAAATVAPLVLVSGTSPYAGCTADAASKQSATNMNVANSVVEPNIAVNAQTVGTDHLSAIGVWQQDRWSSGAARGLVAGYTFDGGKTWAETPLPFSVCASGDQSLQRASDPWVSIGPDGTAYAISIAFGVTQSDVVAATSIDGGKTWGNVRKLIDDTRAFNDKETITADPLKAGTAYAVWDRTGNAQNAPQPAMFSKTTDGGRTWSVPRSIVPTKAPNSGTIGNQIIVDPRTGTMYNVFLSFAERVQYNTVCTKVKGQRQCKKVRKVVKNPPIDGFVSASRSTSGGKKWSTPLHVTPLRYTAFARDAEGTLRTGGGLPEATIDPSSGELYVVWSTRAFSLGHQSDVALSRSSDGGRHWTTPIRVNTAHGHDSFTPSVAVNSSGTVAVTYYDLRSYSPTSAALPAQYWFTSSTDGGMHFGDETRVAGPFDMKSAPVSGGYFLGDYQGLVSAGTSFMPFFAVSNSGSTARPTDIYATTITPQ